MIAEMMNTRSIRTKDLCQYDDIIQIEALGIGHQRGILTVVVSYVFVSFIVSSFVVTQSLLSSRSVPWMADHVHESVVGSVSIQILHASIRPHLECAICC